MAEIHPDAPMDEAEARQKAKNLHEIEAMVNAGLSIARAVCKQESDLQEMIKELETTFRSTYRDFLYISVIITSLLQRPPEEIALAIAIWKQKCDEAKAKKFFSYQHEHDRVC
jgi:hypothetical protein